MNDSEHPKRRRRSALADADDNSNDLLRRERPVEETTEPESFDGKTVKAQKEPHKTKKNLYREARAIATHYGNSIGQEAMYVATEVFQATPESFDRNAILTAEAAIELLRIMGEAVVADQTAAYSLCTHMTKAQLNVMREVQGLPPV